MKNSTCPTLVKKSLVFTLLFVLAINWGLGAQNPLEDILFGTDVNDVPATPINGFIGVALAAGAYFGARKLKRKK